MSKKTSTILLAALALGLAFTPRGYADDPDSPDSDSSGGHFSGAIMGAPAAPAAPATPVAPAGPVVSGTADALKTAPAQPDKSFDGASSGSKSAVDADPAQPLKKPQTAKCDMACQDTQRKEGGFVNKPRASDAGAQKDAKSKDADGSYFGRVRSYEHGTRDTLTMAGDAACIIGVGVFLAGLAMISGPWMLAGAVAAFAGFGLAVLVQSFL